MRARERERALEMVKITCRDCGERKEKHKGLLCYECNLVRQAEYNKLYRERHREAYRERNNERMREWRHDPDNAERLRIERRLPDRKKAQAKYNRKYRRENQESYRLSHRVRMHARRVKISENGGNFTKAEWRALCKKHGNKCLACGEPGNHKTLTIDHVIPVSKGGSNDISNIQPLCLVCNSSKKDQIIDYR
jgi:5-methylcytosine-specific restriction endonuclease McrA